MRRWFRFFGRMLGVVGAASVMVAAQPITFTNVAPSMGIHHFYSGAFLGGGVSFCDFDGDGLEDLTLSSGAGEPIYAYRNLGTHFENVTPQWNLNDAFESETILWADYDNDGDRDLFIANYMGSNHLYRNDGGSFTDVTVSAGISTDTVASIAACWADFNNDGWLDLYIATYSDENNVGLTPNWLYQNQGDGTFIDVAARAGVNDSTHHPLAVATLDYNNDGWQDIYLAHDKVEGNILFRNNGDGTFTDVSAAAHADLHFNCMGIAVGDYDNNGYLDLYVTNTAEGNGLLRNNGDGTFTELADSLGLAVNRVCWGANFFDVDNDGDLDLFVSVSGGAPDRYNVLFQNNGDGTFTRTSGNGLDADTSASFGNAIGDFNNDGYPDIAVLNTTPFTLWENSGGMNRWFKLELQGTASNREGVGSRIEVFAGGQHFIRTVHCGLSYLSQNSMVETIGVGSAVVVDSVIIHWPSGIRDVLRQVPIYQQIRVVEGQTLGIGDAPTASREFVLEQNYPNPFNPTTNLRFRIPRFHRDRLDFGFVRLEIYDVSGKIIRTLVNERLTPGNYEVRWDGTDEAGGEVPAGIYFYRLKVGNNLSRARKMVLLK